MLRFLLAVLTGHMLVLPAEGATCVSPACSICNSSTALCTGNMCPRNLPPSITDLTLIGGKCDEFKSGVLRNQLSSLHNVQFLTLTDCNIRIMWGAPFRDNPNLVKLSLHNNNVQSITNDTFRGLFTLETLNLMRTGITTIMESAFVDLGSLVELDLKLNDLTSFPEAVAVGMHHLEILDLSYNKIFHLDSLHSLTSLTTINLQHNLLQKIPGNLFISPNHLNVIDLNTNMISTLDDTILKGTSLERLDLSSNIFTSVPNLRTCEDPPRKLILKNNTIKSIKPQEFANMAITTLDLSSNPIDNIPEDCFQNSHITYLNLKSTNLNWLPESMSLLTDEGTSLELDGGNWNCECDQLWLGRFLQSSGKPGGPSCGPGKYSGKHFIDVVSDLELECQTTTSTTTDSTTTSTTSTASTTTASTSTMSTSKTSTASKSSHTTELTSAVTFKTTHIEQTRTTELRATFTSGVRTTTLSTVISTTTPEKGSMITKSINTIDSLNTTSSSLTSKDHKGEESSKAPIIAGIVCVLVLVAAVIIGLVLWQKKIKMKHSVFPSNNVGPAESTNGHQEVGQGDMESVNKKYDIEDHESSIQMNNIKESVPKEQKTDTDDPDLKVTDKTESLNNRRDNTIESPRGYCKNDTDNKNIEPNQPETQDDQIDALQNKPRIDNLQNKQNVDPLQILRNFPTELTYISEGPEGTGYPHGQVDGPYRVQFKPKI